MGIQPFLNPGAVIPDNHPADFLNQHADSEFSTWFQPDDVYFAYAQTLKWSWPKSALHSTADINRPRRQVS
jgi:hypothetical protein